jgi:alanyl-tRNA synthetase
MNSLHIRNIFLEFFKSKQHHIVPSAPIVVKDDPTLMFTNAGMNQFKEIFLGNSDASSTRIANTQKCLRVSGKHNDLEEVGYDTYHHTMFEMLGNWSFGDYFKKEAIEWAWELLTEIYKIDKDRLYVSVFGGDSSDGLEPDNEAFEFWKKIVPESRIIYGSKKDNFWEMGDTGPCGPCSEIHVDIRDEEERKSIDGKTLVNKDHPEVIEIWNLVFIEFNRQANGSLVKLPSRHVDTGMGFERLTMALQGKKSNYDTDIFQPIIQEIAQLAKLIYGNDKQKDVAMRVIADHLRAVAFTIADGQLPSNTGAGYVIRRILRRAVRYGFTFLGFEEPFVYKLLGVLKKQMAENFPELASQYELVSKVIYEEEASFLRTLAHGIRRFEQHTESHKDISIIEGNFAFELFDTYGFPIDLTNLLAKEKGLVVDMDGFHSRLNEQKNRSRKAAETAAGDWVVVNENFTGTEFVGYEQLEAEVHIMRYREVIAKKKKHYEIVFNKTPFYAESGGQVGDTGHISNHDEKINIFNTLKENNLIVHLSNELPQNPERNFRAKVDPEKRLQIVNNHSATHIMHAALREVLGNHVEQKGSLVDHERLRFDFSHFGKMTQYDIRLVEKIVNDRIRQNIPRQALLDVPIEEAKAMGAMALFGEKYGEHVRVIMFNPEFSVELCGGTHVESTGQIGSFRIISEGAIAAGVRRIEAVTGQFADDYANKQIEQLQQIREIVKSTGDIVRGVQQLYDNFSDLQKKIDHLLHEKANLLAGQLLEKSETINGIQLINQSIPEDVEMAKNIALIIKNKVKNQIAIFHSKLDGKAMICLMITDDLVEGKNLDASAIIKSVSKEIQGGGGGQKHLATAGGKEPQGLSKAVNIIIEKIKSL